MIFASFLPRTASAFTLLLCLAGLACAADQRPNVVLFLVDDLGWSDLGCYGSTFYETPNLDRLASEGTRFTNGYAACAVCSPTRAAVMTGRYPSRIGITDWIRARFQGGDIPLDKVNPSGYEGGRDKELLCPRNPLWMEHGEVTIAEMLRPLGYTSCHIGKWHLGADDWYPQWQGFDHNYGGCDYGQPPSYFDPYANGRLPGIPHLPPREKGEYLTDREADEAARFIRGNKDGPFFLHLANYAVHTPIQGKKNLVRKYREKPNSSHQKSAEYAAMMQSLDDCVGRVLDTLKEEGLEENTLVIFTSDNGGLLAGRATHNHPLRSGKGYPYEGGIRVPFIVRWPGKVPAATTNDTPVISIDLLPTIAAATGVNLPRREIDGADLVPLLTEGKAPERDTLYWHFPHYRHGNSPYSIIRDGDWKLIKHYVGPRYELFDLANDFREQNNLAPRSPEKVQELEAKLDNWLESTSSKVPKPNPDFAAD